ncbi:hypothetical protein LSCM1_00648 [Leishmania martiniquensis]|uniref:Uncharacterized protein n=1 Tax=Leishmania martiniquensis TaxID=1580590 RepID=A0A836GFV6_9TRYP|nr:hypothetical protein LSCM1_00648 [Leishmania martiniquensis]
MAYIHNGRVVEKKPFTVRGFLLALWAMLSLFVQTLFTTRPVMEVVEEYQHPAPRAANAPAIGGGILGSLRAMLNRRGGGGQALGGGRNSDWAAATNRRGGNVHTLPKPPISGGCASG